MIGYVTVEEAAEYLATRYMENDPLVSKWTALSEKDKEASLYAALDAIEALPFRGVKYDFDQELSFPRFPSSEVPKAVKYAQIECALKEVDDSIKEDQALYDRLWKYGVESYKIGNLSESSSNGSWGHSSGASTVKSLKSERAITLLQPYLIGGFSIE